jgi:hypothetical protein
MTLFELIEPYISSEISKPSAMQRLTWKALCTQFQENPEHLSSLDMFLMSKFVERSVQRNSDTNKTTEVKFLRNIQQEVKNRLIQLNESPSHE